MGPIDASYNQKSHVSLIFRMSHTHAPSVLESEKSLFNVKDRHPQHPALCMMPDASSSSTTRRLGASIAKRAAEEACAHLHEDHQDSCVYDVMATGDIEMAQAVVF